MYPVEYARWLLNPLRYLIMPPSRAELSAGQLTLFDAQALMLEMA
jgi:hypothetical protein